MTRLDDVLALAGMLELPAPGELRWAERAAVGRVREAVARGLAGDELIVDCVTLELERLRGRGVGGGLDPFHLSDDGSVRAAFGYWAPGGEAGAHEHQDWAVTAVVHNRLAVETFDYGVARDEHRLQRKHVFSAERGQVGNICEPCVHNPVNGSADWSVSLHVFGPNDRAVLDTAGRIPGLGRIEREASAAPPSSGVVSGWHRARMRSQAHRLLADMLSAVGTSRALALRARIDGSALARAEEVELGTELRRTVPVALEVRTLDCAELVLGRGDTAVVLLRVDAAAAPLLRHLAEAPALRAADLPGAFADGDRLALVRALVESGLFVPVGDTAPARGVS